MYVWPGVAEKPAHREPERRQYAGTAGDAGHGGIEASGEAQAARTYY